MTDTSHVMLPTRFLPTLGAFALGAAFSWWIAAPATVAEMTGAPNMAAREAQHHAVVVELADLVDEPPVGLPPDAATVPKSGPGAGQRRPQARALAELEQSPAESPSEPNPELGAELAADPSAEIRKH